MIVDLVDDRDRSLHVGCPYCLAEPGQFCTRPDGLGGRVELQHFAAHAARLKAAGVRHAPLDPRDLSGGA